MSAYVVGLLTVSDPEWQAEYRSRLPAVIRQHGGRVLTAGAKPEILEGVPAQPDALVIIEFPTLTAAKAWYADPEHQPLIRLRQGGSSIDLFLIDGPAAA